MIDWQRLVVAPCTSAFGQPAVITWKGRTFQLGSGGVFDEAFSQTTIVEGMPVSSVRPCLGINTADVNLGGQPISALQGARATVFASPFAGGAPAVDTDYIVQEAQADGHGGARLMLNLAPTAADEPAEGGQDE